MSEFDKMRDEQHMDPEANEPWQIVKQTEGMDADETRKVAGPDWDPSVRGDVNERDVEEEPDGSGQSR